MKEERGSMVLEAALVLPVFMCLILLLIAMIQISLTEMALQTAVSETVKVAAANMYPVEQLYREGKEQWAQGQAGQWLQQAVSRVNAVKDVVHTGEAFVEKYEAWIPSPVTAMVQWEAQKREELERLGADAGDAAKQQLRQTMFKLLQPVLAQFAHPRWIRPGQLTITDMQFPDLDNKDEAYLAIEASYELKLAVPLFNKRVTIKKRALERVWIGAQR